jgi:hypothetical protein
MGFESRSLTAKQAVAVILAIVVVTALGYGAYQFYTAVRHTRLVRAYLPKALEELRRQRTELITAIEEYHKQYGFYPPARPRAEQAPGVINPLFYELAGTRFHPNQQDFYDRTQKEPIHVDTMVKNFGVKCFTNSLPFPTWPTDFLAPRQLPKKEFSEGADIYGVGFNTGALPGDVVDDLELTPWRYTVGSSTHNPGRFDLWIEMNVHGKHYLVGNWSGADGG